MNKHPLSSTAVHLFRKRKAGEPTTEASLQPDADLMWEMNDRGLRVQDLIEALAAIHVDTWITDITDDRVAFFVEWYTTRLPADSSSPPSSVEKSPDTCL